jgi:hypothetical protein
MVRNFLTVHPAYHLINSGTTLALVSDSVVSAIYDAIPGSKMDSTQGGWIYPEGATVPKVEIAVGDNTFKLNAADFSLGSAGAGMLFGGVQSRGSNGFDILGDGEFYKLFKISILIGTGSILKIRLCGVRSRKYAHRGRPEVDLNALIADIR